ncbi:MAG: cation:proton antiporter [Clostridia bacterium]|nr:cation:proton antiporter [Clostridia bacterium]
MAYFEVLLPLALILFLSKIFSILAKRIGLPQVVGMILAGLLIGTIRYIPNQTFLDPTAMEGLGFIAKIGVILIMFSAGIETDLGLIKKTGFSACIITILGVIVPLGLGFIVATAFNGQFKDWSQQTIISNLFYGIILTATSVSVTVATLKELGKLNSKVGTAIVSAAIIDDIIGVIILSIVIGINKGETSDLWLVFVKTIAFFVACLALGIVLRIIFKKLEDKYPHNRRIPIFGYALCFVFAFSAEKFFGVADITGAFFAGLILSRQQESEYIESKIDITNYMIFAPVFFANIGITTTFDSIDLNMLYFGLAYIAVAILGKVLGCGLGAKLCKYSWSDSIKTGIGMMVRAEVALVCTQKGVENGLVSPSIMPFVLIIIILTSFITPILFKIIYKHDDKVLNLEKSNLE